jgi:predicted alpha/beta hydrolase family esterase
MTSQVLFIQGAGEGAYKEDEFLAQSLQKELGSNFNVLYPEMPDEANAPYDVWKQQILDEIAAMHEPVILTGHSMGASYLAKILTEVKISAPIVGIFLLAAPFWGGKGWLYEGYEELELPKDTAAAIPKEAKVFLYQAHDDEIVPFSHLSFYAKLLPQATVRNNNTGGHQFNNDLSLVAKDIKNLV